PGWPECRLSPGRWRRSGACRRRSRRSRSWLRPPATDLDGVGVVAAQRRGELALLLVPGLHRHGQRPHVLARLAPVPLLRLDLLALVLVESPVEDHVAVPEALRPRAGSEGLGLLEQLVEDVAEVAQESLAAAGEGLVELE